MGSMGVPRVKQRVAKQAIHGEAVAEDSPKSISLPMAGRKGPGTEELGALGLQRSWSPSLSLAHLHLKTSSPQAWP